MRATTITALDEFHGAALAEVRRVSLLVVPDAKTVAVDTVWGLFVADEIGAAGPIFDAVGEVAEPALGVDVEACVAASAAVPGVTSVRTLTE
jgi:hypothetical protein